MNIPPLVILHDDLIVEVLTLLDVKSLMLMKCVCKSWKTLISDPYFAKMHLKKQSTPTSHLAFLSNISEGLGECRAVPISRLLESNSHSITHTDPYHQFFYKDVGRVVGSCNGLVCMQDSSFTAEYHEHSFSFWNPATRTKSETLVSFRNYPNPKKNICKFAFGYDNSTDTYKIVLLCMKRDGELITTAVRIFTLGDNDWREIDCLPVVVVCHPFGKYVRDGVYLNSSISWCVRHRYNCHLKNLTVEQLVMISFHLGTERYTQLLLPRCCDEELHDVPTLSVLMDCLCFSHDFKKTHFVLWQMKEFGVEESWTEFLKISYVNLPKDIKIHGFHNGPTYYPPQLIPLCFSNNGDILIFTINLLCFSNNGDALIFTITLPDQAFLYNWRDDRVKRIKSTNKILWFSANGYVESLVSIF